MQSTLIVALQIHRMCCYTDVETQNRYTLALTVTALTLLVGVRKGIQPVKHLFPKSQRFTFGRPCLTRVTRKHPANETKQTYITHEDEVTVEKIDHLIKSLLATVVNGMLMCRPLMLQQEFIL